VIRQSPEGGTADKNSVVQLIVSKGPPLVAVPDLVGANVTDAQAALTAVGLVPAVQQIPAGPGTVRSQSPGGGDKIAKGSTVTLYVF
jgi:serine/threonine-protein kinase